MLQTEQVTERQGTVSRSGYSEDLDNWQLIKWRGMVASSTRGRRGQQFFADLLAALEAMPEKVLIADKLEKEGAVCAIGSLGRARGIDMQEIDPDDPGQVSHAFNIAECLAQEVVYMNDECISGHRETPEQRWTRMHKWVKSQILTHDEVSSCDTRRKGGIVAREGKATLTDRAAADPVEEMEPETLQQCIDIIAAELHTAWQKYEANFGEPPHGTLHQLKALLCFTSLPQRLTKEKRGTPDVNDPANSDSR